MSKTLTEIARFLGAELVGDGATVICGVAGIQDARQGDITFLANPKYMGFLEKTGASCIIVSRDVSSAGGKALLRIDNPSLAFTKVVSFLYPQQQEHFKGVHPSAVISPDAALGPNVSVGAGVVIAEGARIGERTVVYPNTVIGREAVIGKDCLLWANVSVREKVQIGDRVIIHNGAVIGSDGFGFVTVDGEHHKIPQIGIVVVGDDVEIGANVAIDRARFDKTSIGSGTKIDNLVHIAHNVSIGRNCLIVAQVGISGSTTVGDNVILAGQVGVVGHIHIGDNSIVMAQSGVSKSLPEGSIVWGTPAKPADTAKRVNAYLQGLPKLHDSLKELKAKVEKLSQDKKV